MKKFLLLASVCLAAVVAITSCGTKKSAGFDGNQEVKNPPAITKALEKPSTRAYGTATQFDLGFATRTASAAARQALAAQVRQILTSNNKLSNYAPTTIASDGKKAASAKDEEGQVQEMMEAIVANIPIAGAVVIENNIYKTRDGQYQVFICVEYQGDAMKLASDMAEAYRNYVEQHVSPEKREEIRKRAKEFEEDTYRRIKEIGA